ncbi:hypothetical protein DFH08DRAFT_844051 [Mycena albidolilacea]|uniref:C3H1-type domain-containing protein n=1 Tax=Mycena albidolilacea TaxID=1033008 RepID=A0AAD7AKH0_9AGAR|nr:hypothetical protein DFH08DRAFT_844051 [Mycena albidolilacea]
MRVRCKWYDDEGHPFGDGCRSEQSGDCGYVHPTSPEWNNAIRRATATVFPPRGRGRGRGGFSSPTSRDSGWSNRKPSNSNSDWDTEGWKPKTSFSSNPPPPSSVASSSGDPEPSTRAFGWGSSDGGSKPGDKADNNSGGWGGTTKKAGGNTGGWGSTEGKTGGWGTGAWGDTEGGWGSGSTWDTPTTGSGSVWDAPKAPAASTSGGWGDSSNNATSAASTSAIKAIDPPIVPRSTQTSRPEDLRVDVDKIPIDAVAPPQSASSYRAASIAPSVCATPQSAFTPFFVPRSVQNMTRSEIHSGIIKNSVRVTCIRLELRELERELERWKLTQLSEQFHRVSEPAAKRLDGIRNDLKSQINIVKTRLKAAEDELVRLPELPSSAPDVAAVDQELMAYTEELKAWLQSFTALIIPETKPPPSSDSSVMDLDEPDSRPGAAASLVAEIEERITELQEILDEVESAIESSEVVSHAAYIEEEISAARSKIRGKENWEQTAEGNASVAALQSAADGAQKQADLQAEQFVLLQEMNEAQRNQNAELKKQRDQNQRLLDTMQAQLDVFQKQKEERAKQLALLAEQFSRFAANPRKASPPVLDDDLRDRVQTTVEGMIQGEVVPALQIMGTRFTEAIERRMTSLQQSIQPAVDQTNEICRRAEAIQLEQ